MALDEHPHVFRFAGRLWVSRLPSAQALAQLNEQQAWDRAQFTAQRWLLAITLGAAIGTALTLGLGTAAGLGPATYIVLLPLGFGAGTVVGAVINRSLLPRFAPAPATERPTTAEFIRIPSSVARRANAATPVDELIAWSRPGSVSERD